MDNIKLQELKKQIAQYRKVKRTYKKFADILKRVLEDACKPYFSCAFVQARAKEEASFAEKVVRKAGKYQNAILNMTDLCAARVIVQTLSQVQAVREFIHKNFDVCEEDDKTASLRDDVFGYGDLHFIVQLKSERLELLGISVADAKVIGNKKAEIQVRTWLQHALADTLHDRRYKAPQDFSREINRSANMLEAIRESADKALTNLCADIDERLANYSKYASRKECEEKISQLKLLLGQEDTDKLKWKTALECALLQSNIGQYEEGILTLSEYAQKDDVDPRVLIELGGLYRGTAKKKYYPKARKMLERAIERLKQQGQDVAVLCSKTDYNALMGCAHFRLAKVFDESDEGSVNTAAEYQKALDCIPRPYWLSESIRYTLRHENRAIKPLERNFIKAALVTCYENIRVGTDMPYSCFSAGRLNAFLKKPHEALEYYALGVTYIAKQMVGVPENLLISEYTWLDTVVGSLKNEDTVKETCAWCSRLLKLANEAKLATQPERANPASQEKVYVIAGDLTEISSPEKQKKMLLLKKSILKDFDGTVYGTNSQGENLTFEQIFSGWEDILKKGINPETVNVFGFGGTSIRAFEYKLALMFGAQVWLFDGFGGTAEQLGKDENWTRINDLSLFIVPDDDASHKASINQDASARFTPVQREEMGKKCHANYVKDKRKGNLKDWEDLEETFKIANHEQAAYSVKILEASGFTVKHVAKPKIFAGFTSKEIEIMAELEHGRWNVERLGNGWRYGKKRDDNKKIHDNIIPWRTLPDNIKQYDRDSVKKFPEILAQTGWEVRRIKKSQGERLWTP